MWLMQENGLYEPGIPTTRPDWDADFGNPDARERVFESRPS